GIVDVRSRLRGECYLHAGHAAVRVRPHELAQDDVVPLPEDRELAVGQGRIGAAARLCDMHRAMPEWTHVALLHHADELVAAKGGAVLPLGEFDALDVPVTADVDERAERGQRKVIDLHRFWRR